MAKYRIKEVNGKFYPQQRSLGIWMDLLNPISYRAMYGCTVENAKTLIPLYKEMVNRRIPKYYPYP